MRILHYFLGFPPYRTGGLTKFSYDLITAQANDGHDVMALWPGEIRSYSAEPKIVKRKNRNGVADFEIINPLPVPLDEGIAKFEVFTKTCDISIFIGFLEREKPDVIHIHTLMGLYSEFVEAANILKIRTIFTTHDYFGLCPKVTFFRFGTCCDDDNNCQMCVQCNSTALSLRMIQLVQSPLYRNAKNMSVIKKIRQYHRNYFFNDEKRKKSVSEEECAKKYRELREYYVRMYKKIDFIHFNSTLTEVIYNRYFVPKDSGVISISHQGIVSRDRNKVETGKKVILFLSQTKPYKGWNILKEACDQLWLEGEKIELRVYCPVQNPEPYMTINEEGFEHSELPQVMSEADVLVAPSICYETFGLTVLEALSYGVPVVVSDHVGAKDIIRENGIVVKAGDVGQLKKAILDCMHIDATIDVKSWNQFMGEMYSIYTTDKNCE